MKVRILATGNVEEHDPSYATRLVDMGYAVPVPAGKKPAAVTVEVTDKVPEPATAEEPKTETKPAKSRKAK